MLLAHWHRWLRSVLVTTLLVWPALASAATPVRVAWVIHPNGDVTFYVEELDTSTSNPFPNGALILDGMSYPFTSASETSPFSEVVPSTYPASWPDEENSTFRCPNYQALPNDNSHVDWQIVTVSGLAPGSHTVVPDRAVTGFPCDASVFGHDLWPASIELNFAPSDTDGDGLTDNDETTIYGTNPNDPDTDGDGLLDGTEVAIQNGGVCPDPLNADSDFDTLLDGAEDPTDPCNADTDGDGIEDAVDDQPIDPGISNSLLEELIRLKAELAQSLDLSLFTGKNDNARRGRRNSLANRIRNAANAIAREEYDSARDLLTNILQQIDGVSPPPDWMLPSATTDALAAELTLLRGLIPS